MDEGRNREDDAHFLPVPDVAILQQATTKQLRLL
jgi:hypothetical protein